MTETIQVLELTNLTEQSPNALKAWLDANSESPQSWAVMNYLTHLLLTHNISGDFKDGFTQVETEKIKQPVEWATIINRQLHIKFKGKAVQIYYPL